MLNERTPVARFESQRNERNVCEEQSLWFGGRYNRQPTLAIRIAAIPLAGDSAITIARFRPSKVGGQSVGSMQDKRSDPDALFPLAAQCEIPPHVAQYLHGPNWGLFLYQRVPQ